MPLMTINFPDETALPKPVIPMADCSQSQDVSPASDDVSERLTAEQTSSALMRDGSNRSSKERGGSFSYIPFLGWDPLDYLRPRPGDRASSRRFSRLAQMAQRSEGARGPDAARLRGSESEIGVAAAGGDNGKGGQGGQSRDNGKEAAGGGECARRNEFRSDHPADTELVSASLKPHHDSETAHVDPKALPPTSNEDYSSEEESDDEQEVFRRCIGGVFNKVLGIGFDPYGRRSLPEVYSGSNAPLTLHLEAQGMEETKSMLSKGGNGVEDARG